VQYLRTTHFFYLLSQSALKAVASVEAVAAIVAVTATVQEHSGR